jgi:hypothetical protein
MCLCRRSTFACLLFLIIARLLLALPAGAQTVTPPTRPQTPAPAARPQTPPAAQKKGMFPLEAPKQSKGGAEVDSADIIGASANDPKVQAALDTVLSTMGSGFNSFSGVPLGGDCVYGSVYGPIPGSFAPSYSIQILTSMEQFSKETAVEAKVSAEFASFSAEVSTKFAQASSSKTSTEFLLVREKIIAGPEINLKRPQFQGTYPADNAGDEIKRVFYQACGDRWISQITMGGEFLAVLSYTQSESQEASSLSVNASTSSATVSGEASFNNKLQNLSNNSSLEISTHQLGGTTKKLPKFNMEGLIQYTRNFPSQITAATVVPVAVATKSYSDLRQVEPDFTFAKRNYDALAAARERVANHRLALKAKQALLKQYSVPSARSANDVGYRLDADLANSDKAFHAMTQLLDMCANYFWRQLACNIDPSYMNFNPGGVPPVIVKEISPNSPDVVNITTLRPMTLELRGEFCYGGRACAHDGISNDPNVGIFISSPNNPRGERYLGKPIQVGAGRVIVQVMDSDYSDNAKDGLKAVLY